MNYDYDRDAAVAILEDLASIRLSGPTTLTTTTWNDGDFEVEAYHTIDATYPFEAEARGGAKGCPFYRERLIFSTVGESEGWIRHEVVRRRCGETGNTVIHSDQFSGYTANWPEPLKPNEESENGPRSPYQGRFA
ncbi:hypothetical protein [Halalkalicoccus jeotgali]|uniref:Uncharacterized protein n=1 Tax=Halalkalicoccus jeotgali (strain DSM 18796 / CECT 7217 / JCM 14584 / KCTC 4019 / B3) TaxID=795797 RepID=D8J9W3_HALJB|nr:hypothetical protein [Halalkalicoccus jeotgali]ADJ14485.1 hypothetical protein HacjB3_05470 [Halalkalicoccus jeotgali B3]ELY40199.1 hypothetical protein C497_03845 [Halalkalicoccus jeotgali B3]